MQDRAVTVFRVTPPKGDAGPGDGDRRLGQSHQLSVIHVNGDAGTHSSSIF